MLKRCGYVWEPIGTVCGLTLEYHVGQVIGHDYQEAVVVPLPLDREPVYEAVATEMFGPDGPQTGPDERTARYAADAAIAAVLGVTE